MGPLPRDLPYKEPTSGYRGTGLKPERAAGRRTDSAHGWWVRKRSDLRGYRAAFRSAASRDPRIQRDVHQLPTLTLNSSLYFRVLVLLFPAAASLLYLSKKAVYVAPQRY